MYKTTPTPTVLAVTQLNIIGNVIPLQWLQTITFESGKPDLNAIFILSDIVFWYRAKEIRDEITGQVVRLEKRFHADLLQRSYTAMSEMFGLTKRQVKDACHRLQQQGVIKLQFRTVNLKDGRKASNVLFIDLDVAVLRAITFERDSYDVETEQLLHSNGTAITVERDTNTQSTTQSTTKQLENENLNSDKEFVALFGEKKPQSNDIVFTAADLLDPHRKQLMQEHLTQQRQQRLDNAPWLQFNPGRYAQRGEIDGNTLQYIDWVLCNETGLRCTSPKKKDINGWIAGLEDIYYAANGQRLHIIAGIRTAWSREQQYRPSNPQGFVNEVRKAAAASSGTKRSSYDNNSNEGRVQQAEVVHIRKDDEQ